jgi:hypothetical protein
LVEREAALYCSVDDVPDALVRTPLQRAIQILKRHRDMRFLGHEWQEQSPISIIITTLAAQAYQHEGEVYSAVLNVVERLAAYADLLHATASTTAGATGALIAKKNGRWYIPNPVNRDENFADRWNDAGSHRAQAFFLWLNWVKTDLETALAPASTKERRSLLERIFGQRSAQAALAADQLRSVEMVYPMVNISNPSKPWGTHGSC